MSLPKHCLALSALSFTLTSASSLPCIYGSYFTTTLQKKFSSHLTMTSSISCPTFFFCAVPRTNTLLGSLQHFFMV